MAKDRQDKKNIAINKVMAKSSSNPDFKNQHPDWCRDASGDNPSYTILVTKTKETNKKFRDEVTRRTLKRIGQ